METLLHIFLTILLFLAFATPQEATDYALFGSHSLEFPLIVEDMQNWETTGASILGKTRLFLNPEVKQRQGLVYNTIPLLEKEWVMDIEFMIGNTENSVFGTNGMAIYFLQEILSKEIDSAATFGYTNNFIGAAVYLNSALRKRDPSTRKRLEGIQGVVGDGSKNINTWEISNDDTCYFDFRSDDPKTQNDNFNTLRLHFNHDLLDVLFFDKEKNEFMH
jgi:hypothetical protein